MNLKLVVGFNIAKVKSLNCNFMYLKLYCIEQIVYHQILTCQLLNKCILPNIMTTNFSNYMVFAISECNYNHKIRSINNVHALLSM